MSNNNDNYVTQEDLRREVGTVFWFTVAVAVSWWYCISHQVGKVKERLSALEMFESTRRSREPVHTAPPHYATLITTREQDLEAGNKEVV